ncbi:hypothetical protein KKH3_23180 [Pectobacterium actinidiae]|nr:hypothetical protein KKH3_23180 [Pectobacterium actinidiae]
MGMASLFIQNSEKTLIVIFSIDLSAFSDVDFINDECFQEKNNLTKNGVFLWLVASVQYH